MFSILIAAAACAAVRLWPSADVELKPLADSTPFACADGSQGVRTGTGGSWPGLRLCFKEGERDLSGFGTLSVVLSNATDVAQRIHLSVKNRVYQGVGPEGCVNVPPHAVQSLDVKLSQAPWRLDAPLEFAGMRGHPLCGAGDKSFDLSRTHEVHLFLDRPTAPSAFSIAGVTLGSVSEGCGARLYKAADFIPFVDAFGQFAHDEWPGKIHSEAELRADAEAERKLLETDGESPIPGVDRFGGWAAGPQREATGFFRTEKVNGRWWFVDPDGHLFFSQGVDCLNHAEGRTGVQFRESYFKDLPDRDDPAFGKFWSVQKWPAAKLFYSEPSHAPFATYNFAAANMLRKYGADWENIVADLAHRRLRRWGLNTIGNWSSTSFAKMQRTPYVLTLSSAGAPRLEWANGWWGKLPDASTPRFEELVRQRARAAAAWMKSDPWCLGVFLDNELAWGNKDPRIPAVAETYFSTVRRILKEELPNHLYLGCRLAWATPEVYRIASRHCDVVSVNVYERAIHRDLPEGSEDKPMINGEFHFGALDRGLFHTGLVPTADQKERAKCYRDFVNSCLDHPRFIGTHWFQWKDQPLTGRPDGENYQIGFLTVTDKPYPELVEAARDVAREMYPRRFGGVER